MLAASTLAQTKTIVSYVPANTNNGDFVRRVDIAAPLLKHGHYCAPWVLSLSILRPPP